MGFNLEHFIITIVVLIVSISLHEFGHAISADRLGDPTPRRDGRVTLWPDKHFDPIGFGAILISSFVGFGIGWGKPVMCNPRNFKNPTQGMMIVAICGPVMNLALAIVFGVILRVLLQTGQVSQDMLYNISNGSTANGLMVYQLIYSFIVLNLSLMFFNLIPITPLDGSKILSGFLPVEYSMKYERFMGQYGIILLGILLMTRSLSPIISPAVVYSLRLLLGNYFGN